MGVINSVLEKHETSEWPWRLYTVFGRQDFSLCTHKSPDRDRLSAKVKSETKKEDLPISESVVQKANPFGCYDEEELDTFAGFDWQGYLKIRPDVWEMHQEMFILDKSGWVQFTEIEPDIYLGGIPHPRKDEPGMQDMDPNHAPHSILFEHGIKTIISFSDHDVEWNFGGDITYSLIVIWDYPDRKIELCFSHVISRIAEARQRGEKVLIHCHGGYSRSVTSLMAFYLVAGLPSISNPTLTEVVTFIKSKRPFVYPNIGFFAQLVDFAERLAVQRNSSIGIHE